MSTTKAQAYETAKLLHWVGLVVVGFNLLSGWRLDTFELDVKQVLVGIHASVGVVIFLLMSYRWWWRRKHKLYVPPRWYKRPSMLVQWLFYPLTLLQVGLGVLVASVINYKVVAFGRIPVSSLATDSERLQNLFLGWHGNLALFLIALVAFHGLERWRLIFVNDAPTPPLPVKAPVPAAAKEDAAQS
jgi:cytochrome b561